MAHTMTGEDARLALVDALCQSSPMREALVQIKTAEREERCAHVEAIVRTRAAAAKELDALRKATDRAVAEQDAAGVEASRKRDAASRALAHQMSASLRFQADIGEHERRLRDTADPQLDAFKADATNLFERVRSEGVTRYANREFDPKRGTYVVTEESNSKEVAARLRRIRDAIDRAEAMKLEIIDDVPAALAELWASVA